MHLAAIKAKHEIFDRQCPACGVDIYSRQVRILSIDEGWRYDTVTLGCKCGAVFKKREVK
jgi:hypothetical protein